MLVKIVMMLSTAMQQCYSIVVKNSNAVMLVGIVMLVRTIMHVRIVMLVRIAIVMQ